MSAWRAMLRLAARDARRSRGRSVLVALMVLVPVAVVTGGTVLARSAQLDPQDVVALRLGHGEVQARAFGGFDGHPAQQDAAAQEYGTSGRQDGAPSVADVERRLQELVGPRDRLVRQVYGGQRAVTTTGRVFRTDVGELDVTQLGAGAPVSVVAGRAPAADDEVLLQAPRTGVPSVSLGGRLTLLGGDRADRSYVVVGMFRATDPLGTAAVLGRPGALVSAAEAEQAGRYGGFGLGWFVVGPDPVSWAQVRQVNAIGGVVTSRAAVAENPRVDDFSTPTDRTSVVTGAVVVVLLLLQVVLMVGPALAVGARRNERLLAVVGATGGTPRHLAGVVVLGAAVVGLGASVAGVVLGLGAGAWFVGRLGRANPGDFPRVDVHVADLVGLVVVGTLTAVAAALLPALRVSRLDVVAALTGRRARTAPRRHLPALGLALLTTGAALAVWGSGRGSQLLVVLGIAAGEVGLVLATSAVLALFARLAGRLPLSARFALRDAARQRSRTVPALAATIAAIAAATASLVFAASQAAVAHAGYRQQTAIGVLSVPLGGPTSSDRADAAKVADALTSALRARDVATLWSTPSSDGSSASVTVWLPSRCTAARACSQSGVSVLFADPGDAALVAPDGEQARAALEAGKAVVWDRSLVGADGAVPVTVSPAQGDASVRRVPAVVADGPQKLDKVLAPRSLAAALGVTVVPDTLAVRDATTDPAALARFDAALAAVDPGLAYGVQPAEVRTSDDRFFLVVVALAGLVALVGTFIAVGLAAADARPDLGTLAAVGADPAVRRRIGAGQAGAVAVPGALVGGLAGVLAGWVLVRLNSGNGAYTFATWHLVVPPGRTAAVVLGIPLLAVALGWLTVRSRLDVLRRLGE